MRDLTLRAVRIEDIKPGSLCLIQDSWGLWLLGYVGDGGRQMDVLHGAPIPPEQIAGLWLLMGMTNG